ncbi:membrane protein [Ferrigenium kumadai]|uniref:Membrane protein n=1 Tax=Ferrigenium kumadai TaxID=1682490 RepID=A0AAN1W0W9_9PROT|nr:energy-coupling factor ABC transporter permease [Ferrigenium kumadai]BBI99872.1 membrane protein [Ferrigenium kumadai]
MNLPAQLFPSDWLWLGNLIFVALLGRAIWFAPWRDLLSNAARTNALVALTMGAFVLWQLNAGFRPGFNHHILGATLFVLMFGWQIAIAAISLIMFATWIRMGITPISLGINGLIMIVIPVLFSEWVLRLSRKRFPKNLFLYVLGNGFLCGGLAIMLTVAAATLLMVALTPHTWQSIQHNYLIATPIIMLTEAFTTGMMITAFTVFQPQAVLNFSDEEYINGK